MLILTKLVKEYEGLYTIADSLKKGKSQHAIFERSSKDRTWAENFLEQGNYKGFTDTFEDLHE